MRYRPVDLARAADVSAATVRMYEREGFLPPAKRSDSGHRQYRDVHLQALLTSRALMKGYGWEYARRVMRAVHCGDVSKVVALVDARHAALHQSRLQVEATVAALRVFDEDKRSMFPPRNGVSRIAPLQIAKAAQWAGVPVSSLRFWEQQGVITPDRESRSNYRIYSRGKLEQLRIVVVLRHAGYDFEKIRRVMDELGKGNPKAALEEVRKRQLDLTEASFACIAATAALWRYHSEFRGLLTTQVSSTPVET